MLGRYQNFFLCRFLYADALFYCDFNPFYHLMLFSLVTYTICTGAVMFGTQTHYKLTDDGKIIFRVEGEHDNLPIFEQLAVIHEVGLMKDWFPHCNSSQTLEKLGPAELLA